MIKDLKSKTIIIENGRCAWGRCIFCVLSKKKTQYNKSSDELKEEFLKKLGDISSSDVEIIKIYNSGTFIDDRQIPRDVRKFIFKTIKDRGIKKVVIEVWPPFITDEKMAELKEDSHGLEVHLALGLESADNNVLKIIKKGFTLELLEQRIELAKKYGFRIRLYVMVNLPGVNDPKQDFENTINYALKRADSIAVMNTFAYSGYAELFDWYLEGKWKPLSIEEFLEIVSPYKEHPKVEIYERDYVIPPHFPEEYKERAKDEIIGATLKNLIHPYYEIWQDYISRFYVKPSVKKYALFLHCSYKKPYSLSKTHQKILKYLRKIPNYNEIHQIIISNPGVIPREFENKYPFNAYDWPEYEETPEIKKKYVEVNTERLIKYLKRHRYKIIFSYLKPDSESYIALKNAIEELNLNDKFINVFDLKRYDEIKHLKGAYVDDLLLERMVKNIIKHI